MTRLRTSLDRMTARAAARLTTMRADDRGDVPGWVLITLMTAGLVLAIWAIAGNALAKIFQDALDSVTGEI